jgi:hypothetical protein
VADARYVNPLIKRDDVETVINEAQLVHDLTRHAGWALLMEQIAGQVERNRALLESGESLEYTEFLRLSGQNYGFKQPQAVADAYAEVAERLTRSLESPE